MTLTFGSLFAGIGGFDAGFSLAGLSSAWQVEVDAKCQEVLAHHWPDVKRYGDVRDVGKRNLEPVDLVCGGFPCQDLSVAGKREGLAGERSGLWFEFHRILAELQPRWAVIENVPGLLSSANGRDFAALLAGLTGRIPTIPKRWQKSGIMRGDWYNVAWRVLDLQYYGPPQRRKRVFLVASLGNGRCAEVLFEREGGAWDSPPSRETGQSLAGSIGMCSESGGFRQDLDNAGAYIPTLSARMGRYSSPDPATGKGTPIIATFQNTGHGWWNESPMAQSIRTPQGGGSMEANVVAYGLSENQRAEVRLTDYSRQITSGGGKPGQGYPAVAFQLTGDRDNPSVSTYDEVHPTLPANPMSDRKAAIAFTERTRADGRIATRWGVRRLTALECERLQGFPDNWTNVNGMSDSARYRMLGNAVGVPVAEWLGRRIIEADGQ